MGSGIHRLQSFATCEGRAVVLGRLAGADYARSPDVTLTLASILGERDVAGEPARTIVLRVWSRDDAVWAAPAVDWLSRHGRRVLVRTGVGMSRALVDAAARWGATVVLELAHGRADLQRALLGSATDPAPALLLHAQHLRARDVEVVASLGPLLPTLHDRTGAAASLMHHVVAADIRDAHLSIGRLGVGRLEALARSLPWADILALARAFDLPVPADRSWPEVAACGARLSVRAHMALYQAMRRLAEACELRIDHCGCPAHCHLDPERVPEYVPLGTSELLGLDTG